MERLRRRKPNHTARLAEELATELDALIAKWVSGTPLARRLVNFVVSRYPHPSIVTVACQLCDAATPLLLIHRRVAPPGWRPGTSDCDVNPLASPFVFLCEGCTAKLDAGTAPAL